MNEIEISPTGRWEEFIATKRRIQQQTDAEFAFAEDLEAQGMSCADFKKQWKLSTHQFNVLAQFVHGVNDEEPVLPPALKALLFAVEAKRAA